MHDRLGARLDRLLEPISGQLPRTLTSLPDSPCELVRLACVYFIHPSVLVLTIKEERKKERKTVRTLVSTQDIHILARVVLLLDDIDEVGRFGEERIVVGVAVYELVFCARTADSELGVVVGLIDRTRF